MVLKIYIPMTDTAHQVLGLLVEEVKSLKEENKTLKDENKFLRNQIDSLKQKNHELDKEVSNLDIRYHDIVWRGGAYRGGQ